MIKGRDIVMVGLASLDSRIGSNVINLAEVFSKHNRVLYVNYPMDRLTLWRGRRDTIIQKRKKVLRGKIPDMEQVNENMWSFFPKTILESINQLPVNWLFDILNRINNNRFAREVNRAIKKLDFKDIIIFNDTDMFRSFYLKELIHAKTYVYYTRDNMLAVDYWKRQGTRIEPALMKKVDLIVANSTYLADIGKRYNPHSFYVGQGCDVSLFDKKLIKEVPPDLKPIKKPVIGYIGVLYTLRLDIDVLVHIAKSRPDWSLMLVGPEDEEFKASELHQIDNVYFLGRKKMEELPAYLSGFDVALNPQKLNEVTIGNYPRKIDEYLAMGKPTVATKTKAMEVFEEWVYLAKNKEEYVQLIEKALAENTPEKEAKREEIARSHTWVANAEAIYEKIEMIEKMK
jgi:glycosyltransferase involved in cell wall biosynthesis